MALCCRRRVLRLLMHYMTRSITHSLHWCRIPMLNSILNKMLLHIHV